MSTAVRRAIYGKLAGDNTLTALLAPAAAGYSQAIYYREAPSNARLPFVIFNRQSGTPREAMGEPSAYETDVWLVKAVDQATSADAAEGIAARITTLLNDANLSISGASLLYLRREADVDYAEVAQGELFQHVGSTYRLIFET